MSKVLMCAGLFAAVFACRAATWYVDCQMDDYANHDGSSWSLAYKTIQEAVNAAAANDTIYVAEGHYNEGGDDGGEHDFNRVYLDKANLKLLAVGGKDKTFIEGAHDPDSIDGYGNGTNAVRCVRCTADGCVVSNFTLTGGATYLASEAGENADYANGGAFRGRTKGSTSCLVDCVVTNCVGVRGGALYYGRAVRTLFVDNLCAWKAAAGNNSSFLNCVITRHSFGRNGGSCFVGSDVVNCTIYRINTSYIGTEKTDFRNSVTVIHSAPFGDAAASGLLYLRNSVACGGYTTKGVSFFQNTDNSVTNAPHAQLENPVFGDIRLMPDSLAVGRGDAVWLSAQNFNLPDGVARYVDFTGAPIPETGAINAGAVQAVGPAPLGGRLEFNDSHASVDGVAIYGSGDYVQAVDCYPTQYWVKVRSDAGRRFYGFKRTTSHTLRMCYVFPRTEDDSIYMLPPRAGETYSHAAQFCSVGKYLHVNPVNGEDTAEDGQGQSPDKPFKTIQYALDVASANKNEFYVISCAAGDYDSEDNLHDHRGVTNRVTIYADQKVRIIGAGAGKSIIWGKSDPADTTYRGGGPNAIRCVACLTGWSTAIQGFTFKGGRTAFCGDTTDSPVEKGGGIFCSDGNDSQFYITDSTFDDCVGYRGALFGGIAMRCRFTNCIGYNGGIRYAQVVCSLIENCPYDGANGIMMSYNASYRHMTAVGRTNTDRVCAGNTAVLTNSVLHTFKTLDSAWTPAGSGVYVGDVGGGTTLRATDRDPQLVDPANGDYRLYSSSPAFGGGVDNSDYADYYSPDLNGNPIRFVNGRPTAGAIQDFALGYGATVLNGVTSEQAGKHPLAPGETATVTLDVSSATRPIVAVCVNGEELPYDGTLSWTFSAPADGIVAGPFGGVEPIFSTNWYVNANALDNSGDGFSPATAKKTFHGEGGLMDQTQYAFESGDVIHAAKGFYNTGSKALVALNTTHFSRVEVPNGVTLVADDGPEETFIVGSNATVYPDAKGRGEGAVRCVFLKSNARLRGFTVTGGRTLFSNDDGVRYNGGGVYCDVGGNSRSAVVEDCIISNNAAIRGGGMANGVAIRCQFYDNWAYKNRAALSYGFAYNCLFDHNRGVNTTQNTYGLYNCTFGADCKLEDGTTATPASGMAYGPVINCIFLGKLQGTASNYKAGFTNCVFVTGMLDSNMGKPEWVTLANCQTVEVAQVALDAAYRPRFGESVAIDRGTLEGVAAEYLGEQDLYRGQRIYNGAIDVGAVEADWRPAYSAALGANVIVTNASPMVSLSSSDGRVTLADGASLKGVWRTIDASGEYGVRRSINASALDGTLAGEVGPYALSVTGGSDTFARRDHGAGDLGFDLGYTGTGTGAIWNFMQRIAGFQLRFH